MHHRATFRKDRSNRYGDIPIFVISKTAALLIFEKWKCYPSVRRLSMSVIVPNFIKIGQMVVEIWRFNRFCKMAAVRHFGYVGRVLGAPAMTTIVLQNLAEIDAAVSII